MVGRRSTSFVLSGTLEGFSFLDTIRMSGSLGLPPSGGPTTKPRGRDSYSCTGGGRGSGRNLITETSDRPHRRSTGGSLVVRPVRGRYLSPENHLRKNLSSLGKSLQGGSSRGTQSHRRRDQNPVGHFILTKSKERSRRNYSLSIRGESYRRTVR